MMITRNAKARMMRQQNIKEVRRMARCGGLFDEAPFKIAPKQVEKQAPVETAADELGVFGAARTDVVATNATGEY